MTRKQVEEALVLLKNTKHSTPFREFAAIYEQALYEAALKYGIDPESDGVMFYYDIENGKGSEFK